MIAIRAETSTRPFKDNTSAMKTAFLLRFEEPCCEHPIDTASSMTQTTTNVDAERGDSDPAAVSGAIPKELRVMAGTATVTKIQAEASDRDPQNKAYQAIVRDAIPFVLQTQTVTLVSAEANDQDPGSNQFRVMPKCLLF